LSRYDLFGFWGHAGAEFGEVIAGSAGGGREGGDLGFDLEERLGGNGMLRGGGEQVGELGPPEEFLEELLVNVGDACGLVFTDEPADVWILPEVIAPVGFQIAEGQENADTGGQAPGVFSVDTERGEGLGEGGTELELVEEDGGFRGGGEVVDEEPRYDGRPDVSLGFLEDGGVRVGISGQRREDDAGGGGPGVSEAGLEGRDEGRGGGEGWEGRFGCGLRGFCWGLRGFSGLLLGVGAIEEELGAVEEDAQAWVGSDRRRGGALEFWCGVFERGGGDFAGLGRRLLTGGLLLGGDRSREIGGGDGRQSDHERFWRLAGGLGGGDGSG